MATRLRKTRRLRGSRTHGWGTSGQHRKSGTRGGFGRAGRFKHKWTSVVASGKEGIGKVGFKSRFQTSQRRALNVGELDELIDRLISEGRAKQEEGRTFVDLRSLGYAKLLGGGRISRALTVKIQSYSESAARKIQEAGGQIVPAAA